MTFQLIVTYFRLSMYIYQ